MIVCFQSKDRGLFENDQIISVSGSFTLTFTIYGGYGEMAQKVIEGRQ